MMRADDPPPKTPPVPNAPRTVAIAAATAACTTLATKLIEWGVEELRTRTRKPTSEETES